MQHDDTNHIHKTDTERHEVRGVIDAIRRREVKMRPRWYFVVRGFLLATAAIMVFLIVLYLVSFIIFALHRDGEWFAPGFGASGWLLFATGFPWGLLVVSFALIILCAVLLMRYAFIYHRPLFFVIAGLVLVVLAGGALIDDTTPLQLGLSRYAAANIPILGSFYHRETEYPAHVRRGEIVSFGKNGSFIIVDGFGNTSSVMVPPGTVVTGGFHKGDIVFVFGTRERNGVIKAFGVERVVAATSTGATSSLPAADSLSTSSSSGTSIGT